MTTPQTIDLATLQTVTGGADDGGSWGDTLSNAWQGTKNFAGGATAGALYGVGAKTDQVGKWADTSSQATKAGFELGAMASPRRGFPK